ncbi:MAG: phage tail protein [Actinomycetia bacterium]|nr:phage tail protein [Actinomycetes bacterium]
MSEPAVQTADIRNANFTYAAGDVLMYVAATGTEPPEGFEDLDGAVWKCLGWIDTTGGIFALTYTTKDIGACGSLSAIRTIVTGGTKTLQFQCLEPMNPYVRALFDDVPVEQIEPDSGGGGSSNVTGYVLPEVPLDNRYCFLMDSIDGVKQMRLFAPNGKITARANDQVQQADNENLQMTSTFYPDTIDGIRGTMKRIIGWDENDMPTDFSMGGSGGASPLAPASYRPLTARDTTTTVE